MDTKLIKWDLNPLFSGFDSPFLVQELETLPKELDQLLQDINAVDLTVESGSFDLLSVLMTLNQLNDRIERVYNYASLIYSVDTSDMDAARMLENIEKFLPTLHLVSATLQKQLKTVESIESLIQKTPALSNFKFVLEDALTSSKYLLSPEEELLLAELKNTGSSAWTKLQSQIVSNLTGSFRGEEQTITVLRSKAYDNDPSVRKEAFEAELLAYKKKDAESCACLNAIKGEVILESKKRGYTSPLHKTLVDSRMDAETLDAMMTAIQEYLPYFRQYLEKKATLLGHKNGLPFYDLFAPIGEVDMRYTYEEACNFIVDQFSSFSKELGAFAKKAIDQQWIDVYPREGKVAGAFCANLHSIKESRFMTNFTGSFNDLSTLAHELGHGYHGDCLKDALSLNSDYPMPLAETASIFCETIVFNAALEQASPEEKLVILENSLMGSTQVIVDIYSRYLFETELFARRENASLSVDELKQAMTDAQVKAYGKGLDPETLHPYMWMCKPHYYSAGSNFYNFPYAFGLLFAKGLYAQYQKDQSGFVKKYDELLLATGCNTITDVLRIIGIDSHKPDFFRASLELIKEEIEQFIGM